MTEKIQVFDFDGVFYKNVPQKLEDAIDLSILQLLFNKLEEKFGKDFLNNGQCQTFLNGIGSSINAKGINLGEKSFLQHLQDTNIVELFKGAREIFLGKDEGDDFYTCLFKNVDETTKEEIIDFARAFGKIMVPYKESGNHRVSVMINFGEEL